MAGNSLLVSMSMHGSSPHSVGKPVEAMSLAHAIDGCVGSSDVMVSLQVPNDAYRPHVVRAAEIQDLLDDLVRSLVGMVVVAAAPPTL
jgi:hypothetical protein